MAKVIYCNKCGKKMDVYDTQQNCSIQGQLGYGSEYDGEFLDLDLCCECMDKLINECKISPIEGLGDEEIN